MSTVSHLRPTAATCGRRNEHDPSLPDDALGYFQRLAVLMRDHQVRACVSCGEYRVVVPRGAM